MTEDNVFYGARVRNPTPTDLTQIIYVDNIYIFSRTRHIVKMTLGRNDPTVTTEGGNNLSVSGQLIMPIDAFVEFHNFVAEKFQSMREEGYITDQMISASAKPDEDADG